MSYIDSFCFANERLLKFMWSNTLSFEVNFSIHNNYVGWITLAVCSVYILLGRSSKKTLPGHVLTDQ